MFKYFVSREDPQQVYVWSNLILNFVCFTIIFICYSKVLLFTKSSKQRARMCNHEAQNKRSRDKEETHLQIALIIATDFLCWVPFMSVCMLHSFEIMDATALYPISSIVILPINSVINPILYHDYTIMTVKLMVNKTRYWVSLFYMSYIRRCLLSINKFARTRRKKKVVQRNVDMTPQSDFNANELSGQDDEIRTCNNNKTANKEDFNFLHKNDDTMDLQPVLKSDITKNNSATLNETETEYSKIFLRKEVLSSKFSIKQKILRTISEECETSQNEDFNLKNILEKDKGKGSTSFASNSKDPVTGDENEFIRENGIVAVE